MTALPTIRLDDLDPRAVDCGLRAGGGFLLDPALPSLTRAVVAAAGEFFALPRQTKTQLGIERSPHFRGWSEMHNERDWREQIHLGRERAPLLGPPEHLSLQGPNLWPLDSSWRRTVTAYLDAVSQAGDDILEAIGVALDLPAASRPLAGPDGYLVMKLIEYHAQSDGDTPRPGVASHVDFSWLTLTLQDRPGLEVRTPSGEWVMVEPQPDTLWVHAGEILQFAARGRYAATPHRVVNRSPLHTRLSIPVFVNPPLSSRVSVFDVKPSLDRTHEGDEHVHRVLDLDNPPPFLHFGEAEWRRKGLDEWCARCAAL